MWTFGILCRRSTIICHVRSVPKLHLSVFRICEIIRTHIASVSCFPLVCQASPGVPISVERLVSESGSALPLARMQNVPPPPPGCISQGTHRSGGALVTQELPAATDPYAMSGQERSKYESLFPVYDSDRDGFVTGAEAVELFSKSRLPREVSLPVGR